MHFTISEVKHVTGTWWRVAKRYMGRTQFKNSTVPMGVLCPESTGSLSRAGAASVARGEGPEACDGGAGYSSMCKTPQPCGTSMWHVHPRFTDKATGLVRFAAEGRVGGRCSFTPLSDSHPSLPCSMAKSHTGTTSPASGRSATPSGTPMWRWMASLSSGGMTSRKLRRLRRLEG